MSISFWFNANAATGANQVLINKFQNTANSWGVRYDAGGNVEIWDDMSDLNNTYYETPVTPKEWHHIEIIIQADLTNLLYVDGVLRGSNQTSPNNLTSITGNLYFGQRGNNSAYFGGKIDDVKIYNYARTQAQVVEDMNAGHPFGGSPVASQVIYWKLDEQNGNTINNSVSTQAALSGTRTGATWKLSNECKFNGCLNFGNATDNISGGDVAFVDSLTGMSVSFWTNPTSLATGRSVISKTATSQRNFSIQTDSTNSDELRVYIASSNSDTSNYFTTSDLNLSTAAWQYITVVYDGTQAASDRVKVYKDGVLASGSVTGTIPTAMTSGTTSALRVGQAADSTSAMNTFLDEVKIYTAALTSEQVLVDMNRGSQASFGVLGNSEASALTDGVGNPPVGWWRFDENTGTTASDSSVGGYTGNFESSPKWTNGVYGPALQFNGSTDAVTIATTQVSGTPPFTLSAWIKTTSNDNVIFALSNSGSLDRYHRISVGGTGLAVARTRTAGTVGDATGTTTINDGNWHHIVGVFSATNDRKIYVDGVLEGTNTTDITRAVANIAIGHSGESTPDKYFNGSIDDVRLYNYALTQSQISYLYNRGKPGGHWKFDECSGSTANDSSGNNYHGTISPGDASGTNDSVGTCSSGNTDEMWNNGTNGRFNSSLDFDGTNDYVSIGDQTPINFERTDSFSISGWFKSNSSSHQSIVGKLDTSANYRGYRLVLQNTGQLRFQLINAWSETPNRLTVDTTSAFNDGSWHHVTVTYNGSSAPSGIKIYVDGNLSTMQTANNNLSATILNDIALEIGRSGGGGAHEYFDGQLDDIRIYNYTLSETQVKNILNSGAANRFGI